MNAGITNPQEQVFEKACDFCGATMLVKVPKSIHGEHEQKFTCPECGKSYHTQGAGAPEVALLHVRTDGQDVKHNDRNPRSNSKSWPEPPI